MEGRGAGTGEIVTIARGRSLIMEIKRSTMHGTRTGGTTGGGEAVVDGQVRLDACEGVHVWSPFDECETVEHGQDADIDAIVLS